MRALNEEDGGEGGDQDVGEYLYKGGARGGEILIRDREGCGIMKKSKPQNRKTAKPQNRFTFIYTPRYQNTQPNPFMPLIIPSQTAIPSLPPRLLNDGRIKPSAMDYYTTAMGASEGGRALMV